MDNHGEMLIYQTEDGLIKIDVNMQNETIWLTQEQMGELFQKAKSTINEHIKNIYSEGELQQEETMRKFGNTEFSTKPTNYYNLDVVISVRYRVGLWALTVICRCAFVSGWGRICFRLPCWGKGNERFGKRFGFWQISI